MSIAERPYAGMILPDSQEMDPTPYLDAARHVLMRLDRGFLPRDTDSMVTGRELGIRVTPEEESDFGPRMLLEVVTCMGGTPEEAQDEEAAQLLSDTVLRALDHSQADILEWYSPDVLLDIDDFVRLRSYVSPRRSLPQHMQDAPDVDHIANDARSRLAAPEVNIDEIPAAAKRTRKYPKRPVRRLTAQQPAASVPEAPAKPRGGLRSLMGSFSFLSRGQSHEAATG